jgi:hypothetical protein
MYNYVTFIVFDKKHPMTTERNLPHTFKHLRIFETWQFRHESGKKNIEKKFSFYLNMYSFDSKRT